MAYMYPYPGNPDWVIKFVEARYDRPHRVEVVNQTGIVEGIAHLAYTAIEFTGTSLPISLIENSLRRTFARYVFSANAIEPVITLLGRTFPGRKRVKRSEWSLFFGILKANEVPLIIAEAYFFTTTGKQAYSKEVPFTLTIPLIDEETYLQGASWVQSVYVVPKFQRQGIARTMYQMAEKIFDKTILPSSVLTPQARALHQSLGKISG